MTIKQSIQSYLQLAEEEEKNQRNLLQDQVVMMLEICQLARNGGLYDLNKVGHRANKITEIFTRIEELNRKIVEYKLLLQEFEE